MATSPIQIIAIHYYLVIFYGVKNTNVQQHRIQIIHACLQTLPCFRSPSGSGLMDGVRYMGVFNEIGISLMVLLQICCLEQSVSIPVTCRHRRGWFCNCLVHFTYKAAIACIRRFISARIRSGPLHSQLSPKLKRTS